MVISVGVIPSAVTVAGSAMNPAEAAGGVTNDSVAFCVKVYVIGRILGSKSEIFNVEIGDGKGHGTVIIGHGAGRSNRGAAGYRGKRYGFPADWKSVGVGEEACANAVVTPSAGAEPSALVSSGHATERARAGRAGRQAGQRHPQL